MPGSFTGSQSRNARRRRRLASEAIGAQESLESDQSDRGREPEESAPFPEAVSERPRTDQFPLTRILSPAAWKNALVLASFAGLAGGILALGHSASVARGEFGPGVALLAADHAGGLVRLFLGLLLLTAAPYAGIIGWARSRSQGKSGIWRRTALASGLSGLFLLAGGPEVSSRTIIWLTGSAPFGAPLLYELAPAWGLIVVLFPGLWRETRECRTSQTLLILAAALFLAGGAATFAHSALARLLDADAALQQVFWLAGGIGMFGAFLFQARHLVHQSSDSLDTDRSDARKKVVSGGTKEATGNTQQHNRSDACSQASDDDSSDQTTNAPEKEPPRTRADRWAEVGTVEIDGKVIRLDGPEDPLKGLSKRQRRQLRKAVKDRQRGGAVEY